jgi:hypothetical protein
MNAIFICKSLSNKVSVYKIGHLHLRDFWMMFCTVSHQMHAIPDGLWLIAQGQRTVANEYTSMRKKT